MTEKESAMERLERWLADAGGRSVEYAGGGSSGIRLKQVWTGSGLNLEAAIHAALDAAGAGKEGTK